MMRLPPFPPVSPWGFVGLFLVLAAGAAGLGLFLGWESAALQNVILLLALFVALLSLWSARNTERQKATLDFLREYNDSDVVAEGTRILNDWGGGEEYVNLNKEGRIAVNEFLNLFEMLAIGLKNGIYDEQMTRDALETTIVRYYRKTERFIRDFRNRDNDTRDAAFEHFEHLARRFLKKPK